MFGSALSFLRKNSIFGLSESVGIVAQNGDKGQELRGNAPGTSENAWFLGLGSRTTSSGVSVNHETAQSHSAVWSAVKIMAETMASLSGNVIREESNGDRIKMPIHPVAKVLRNPMPGLYNGYTFMETMIAWATLRGNAIALIMRNGSGTPMRLRHFPLSQVRIDFDAARQMIYYTFSDLRGGTPIVADALDVIHIRSLVWDCEDGWGKSPIQVHRESIGLGLAGQEYMGGVMKNGAHIPGILTTDQKIEKEAAARMSKSWKGRFGGTSNAGNTPVLEQGVKYQQLSLSPADAQWLQVNNATIEDVSRIFRIPLHMLSSLQRSTNNNIEQQALEFVTNTIRPWAKRIESEFQKLFSNRDQGSVYYKFDLNSLLRGDVKSRAVLHDVMMKWGAMSVNELRRLEGLNKIETGEGDTHLYPVNMAPFDLLGAKQQQNLLPDGEEE